MSTRLSDIDELVVKARPGPSKEYIIESVRAYESGAFRSAIISAWIAVVFDIIEKLKELSLSGDGAAGNYVKLFEQAHGAGDIDAALEFERGILDIAKKQFELLNEQEYLELSRLREDRNRCAHPSMAGDDIYRPSAELARYHICSAVANLLQYQPVQGKAALDRLLAQVQSPYFPTEVANARLQFDKGPLSRPRESLVRNFTIVVLKTLLLGQIDEEMWQRYVAALSAVMQMHPSPTHEVYKTKLCHIIREMKDGFSPVVRLMRACNICDYLEEDVKQVVNAYVREMPASDLGSTLEDALQVPLVQDSARERVQRLSYAEAYPLVRNAFIPSEELISQSIGMLEEASSFDEANRIAGLLAPEVVLLSEEHVRRIFAAVVGNGQVSGAFRVAGLLSAIRDRSTVSSERLAELSDETGLRKCWDGLDEIVAENPQTEP